MKLHTEEGLKRILEGITIHIELEKGDKILENDHSGTFTVNIDGLCFKSLDCSLKNYKARTKIKANYMGNSNLSEEGAKRFKDLPWREYLPRKSTKKD